MSSHGSSRRRSTTHTASRPKSTVSAPAGYLSAFTDPFGTSTGSRRSTSEKQYSTRSYPESTSRGLFGSSSTSAYKRSPRSGWLSRTWAKIRKLVRDFVRYAQKHPFKVVIPLVMAIMGSGALAGLVKRFGGLEGLGLGGIASSFSGMGIDKWINVGHGARQGFEGFSGRGLMDQNEGSGGFDGFGMAKGAIKVASAFL